MKKFNLKRVVLTLLDTGKLKSERDMYHYIIMYQKRITKLPQPLDRTNKQFLEYQREIQRLRAKSKNLRSQRLVFEVFVKEYGRLATIEWEFNNKELGPEYRKEYKRMMMEVGELAITRVRQDLKQELRPSKWFGIFNTPFLGSKKTI